MKFIREQNTLLVKFEFLARNLVHVQYLGKMFVYRCSGGVSHLSLVRCRKLEDFLVCQRNKEVSNAHVYFFSTQLSVHTCPSAIHSIAPQLTCNPRNQAKEQPSFLQHDFITYKKMENV